MRTTTARFPPRPKGRGFRAKRNSMSGFLRIRVRFPATLFLGLMAGFSHAAVSPYTSRVVILNETQVGQALPVHSKAPGNGQARLALQVTVRDENGLPLAGKTPTLTGSSTHFVFIQPAVTDAVGVSTGYVSSLIAVTGDVWAVVDGVRVDVNVLDNGSAETGGASPTGWASLESVIGSTFTWTVAGGSVTTRGLEIRRNDPDTPTETLSWFFRTANGSLELGTSYYAAVSIKMTDIRQTSLNNPGKGARFGVVHLTASPENNIISSIFSSTFSGTADWSRLEIPETITPAPETVNAGGHVDFSLEMNFSTGVVLFDNAALRRTPSLQFTTDASSPAAPTLTVAPTAGVNNGEVRLRWSAPGNDGNDWSNGAGRYEIFYATYALVAATDPGVSKRIPVDAPSPPGSAEAFIITGLSPGTTYHFLVRAVDQSGNTGAPASLGSGPAQVNASGIGSVTITTSLSEALAPSSEIRGTAAAGARVNITIDGMLQGSVYADFQGKWRWTLASTLTQGTHVLSVRADDGLGNFTPVLEQNFSISVTAFSAGLKPSYPNPARLSLGQSITIPYALEEAASITLAVYDLTGEEVVTLISGQSTQPGSFTYSWDGRDARGEQAASGIYTVLFQAGKVKQKRQIAVFR